MTWQPVADARGSDQSHDRKGVASILIASADYPPDGGGIGAYAHGLWQGLADSGCDARVLSRHTPSRQVGGSEHLVQVAAGGGACRSLGALRSWFMALAGEARQRRSDWTVIPTWDPVAMAATLPLFRRLLPGKIAVVFHGADVAGATGRKQRLMAHVMRTADRVIANSSFTASLIEQRYGNMPGTVRPAIGDDDLDIPTEQRSPYAVISVGRLVRRKGHLLVLKAIARLAEDYPEISYTIVGDGPERGALNNYAVWLGIRDRVRFLGQVSADEKRRELARASVFALPVLPDAADPEGFGIAYLEAGAAWLPVIATDTGGVGECVKDDETGLFCDPSEESLEIAMRRLFETPHLRHRLGEAGRRLAQASVWRSRAGDLLDVLEVRA